MPELPEVETTRRGLLPHVKQQTITTIHVYNPHLRWQVPSDLAVQLKQQQVQDIERRGKYLLFQFLRGTQLVHLGMSGSLRLVDADTPLKKHDHIEWQLASGQSLRYHDPRRFGCVLWTTAAQQHPLLKQLGIEPFSTACTGEYFYNQAQNRRVAVKNFIMNSHIVVGVGNIYASESLFLAGIHPQRPAGEISQKDYTVLATNIQQVLQQAIDMGGTTLRDFVNSDGQPGYFEQALNVYGRAGKACTRCNNTIQRAIIGQRASYFCTHCQK